MLSTKKVSEHCQDVVNTEWVSMQSTWGLLSKSGQRCTLTSVNGLSNHLCCIVSLPQWLQSPLHQVQMQEENNRAMTHVYGGWEGPFKTVHFKSRISKLNMKSRHFKFAHFKSQDFQLRISDIEAATCFLMRMRIQAHPSTSDSAIMASSAMKLFAFLVAVLLLCEHCDCIVPRDSLIKMYFYQGYFLECVRSWKVSCNKLVSFRY